MKSNSPFFLFVGIAAAAFFPSWEAGAADAAQGAVDFRYSPPEWQTLICLPDDPCKTLVDRSGALLYDYDQGGREFGVVVTVQAASNAVWREQYLQSPRAPIVRTRLTADGFEILEEAFAVTDPPRPTVNKPYRSDLVLVCVTNTSGQTRTLSPRLVVDTTLGCRLEGQRVVMNHRETVACSLKIIGMAKDGQVQLETVTVPAGRTARFFVFHGDKKALRPSTVQEALAARDHAIEYWKKAPLPFDRVQVPDAGIQALVDSSIRNLWQAREIKNGLPEFQAGPTCYRCLWMADGAFLLEAAAMLGADREARNGVAYALRQQKPTGAFEVLRPQYYKENGLALWTCVRHAQLTQDKPWLESVWPKLEKTAAYIKILRQRSLENDTPLDDGINPPGEIDGGLSGADNGFKRPEFSNVYWNLAGLQAFIQGAQWLGKTETAALWQKEYDDLFATFRKAAARDLRQDSQGNSYVPIFMANEGHELPQRAQWAFCHAVYPGQIFAKDDTLVTGALAMLQATEREGMVYGTGWDANGIWNYFASFYGHAWLWQGNGRKAAQILYAFANHACPTLAWREEQSLRGEPFRKVGDMPHNWASAEFIRLTVHLLEMDRGHELHLFEGLPIQWTRPGMATRLHDIATPFGKLDMELKIADDAKTARLRVEPLSDDACRKIIVHLGSWAGGQKDALMELDPKSRNDRAIPLVRDPM